MVEPRRLTLYICSKYSGKTVDTLLRNALHISGGGVRRAKRIPDGILLDGTQVFTNASTQEGQVLSIQIGDTADKPRVLPISGPLSIVYEDEDLLVMDKQAPLSVHPGPGNKENTLANYLQFYYQEIGLRADFHPVNRLDRGTSGLMIVAKHAHAHERLRQLLHTDFFKREYLAVCEGIPIQSAGCIKLPIGRVPGSVLKREVRQDGAAASTEYQVISSRNGYSLVSLVLGTGRTHQIRVHMSSIGCPVVGDFLYGKDHATIKDRFALHAAKLEFIHPITGSTLAFSSPLPSELSLLLTD